MPNPETAHPLTRMKEHGGTLLALLSFPPLAFSSWDRLRQSYQGYPHAFLVVCGAALAMLAGLFASDAKRRRRSRELEQVGRTPAVREAGRFQLTPIETPAHFVRADGAHEKALRWIRETRVPILYLTGYSGTGKSSIVQAWVKPKLREVGWSVAEARVYGDAEGAIARALAATGAHTAAPAEPATAAAGLYAAAAAACGPEAPLLLVLDQFEEFLILRSEAERAGFLRFLRAVAAAPPPGLRLMLVVRSDYQGILEQFGLPRLEQGVNWMDVPAFEECAAMDFIESGGLRLSAETRARMLREARAIEETPGLIRPITLNLFGKVLSQPDYKPRRKTGILQAYLEDLMLRRDLSELAPRLLARMISDSGTKRTAAAGVLAAEAGVSPVQARGCLRRLGEAGLVRELDAAAEPAASVWEVAHDFVARLLQPVVVTRQPRPAWQHPRQWMAIAAVGGWMLALALLLPAYAARRQAAGIEGAVFSNNLDGQCWGEAMGGELDLAAQSCNRSLQLNPEDWSAWDTRGFIALRQDNARAALDDYATALRFNPKLISSLYGRGLAERRIGDAAASAADLEAARKAQPGIAAQFQSWGVR